MSYKDYDAMLAEQLGERPVFKLGGQEFTCRLRLHWAKQSRIFLALANADGEQLSESAMRFVEKCLIPADRERFLSLLAEPEDDDYEDDTVIITRSQINAIVNDLFDHYAGKAETSAGDSSATPPDAGQPSNVVSLNSREA